LAPSEGGNFLNGVTSFPSGALEFGSGYGGFGANYGWSNPSYNGSYGNAYASSPINALPNVGTAFQAPFTTFGFGMG
jgi:hypothetical protein